MFISTKTKGVAAALVAAAAVLAGTPAFAGAFESNGRTAEVRYHDLDLTQADGRAELKRRLNKAAFRVCAKNPRDEMVACRRSAMKNVSEPVKLALAKAQARAAYAEAAQPKTSAAN